MMQTYNELVDAKRSIPLANFLKFIVVEHTITYGRTSSIVKLELLNVSYIHIYIYIYTYAYTSNHELSNPICTMIYMHISV